MDAGIYDDYASKYSLTRRFIMTGEIHPTKLAIMQAAVEVFIQKGFSGATTKEIAQAAGIAEGTVFRHFTSKVEILYSIVEGFLPMIGVGSLKQAIRECEELDGKDAIRHIIENRLNLMRNSTPFVRVILIESNYDPKLRQLYYDQVYQPIQQLLRDFIANGVKRGKFRDVDPVLAANTIVSFITYEVFSHEFLALDQNQDQSFTAAGLSDILLDGIAKRS